MKTITFDEATKNPQETTEPHPRHGYVVEVWLGRLNGNRETDEGLVVFGEQHLVLVEIHECYNIWAQPESLSYHYRPYDLINGKSIGIKTIGALSLDHMRKFAKRYSAPEGTKWKKLR